MQIPLVDLHAQYQAIKPEVMAAFEEVLDSMQLFLGPQLQAFESEFAAYCNSQHGVGVASGTDALTLALRACNIGPGDEVITVSNTFIATVEAIALVGATPVFVDIDPDTYSMDWRQLAGARTPRTRAIIPVHLYGYPANMQPILEFARAYDLRIIEDASQAHGATYQGRRVGSIGDIGCFSLYYSKNLGAYGEAGICVTDDAALAEKLRILRDHGSRIRYHHEVLGFNSRMDELQAAVLRVKLRYLDRWNAARQEHARMYTEQLRGVVEAVPVEREWGTHVYYAYVVQVQQRDHFRRALEQEGIATGVHYPIPVHLQPALAFLDKAGQHRRAPARGAPTMTRLPMLPVTEAAAERIVSLPMYPELSAGQRQMVIDAARKSMSLKAAR